MGGGGIKIDHYLSPGSVREGADQAVWAETIGFEAVFSAETAHDPFLPLAVAASHTERVQLGTAIAVAFARSPMNLAYIARDMAEHAEGRFLLGLGSQIRAHITRRFSMPWSSPGPRMREYIAALRSIWDSWNSGTKLDFQGEFYEFRLMTPFFNPGPADHPDIPIYIAGVGEYMCRLAGEVADGFHVHPFHTMHYLDEVALPNMLAGTESAGRGLQDVDRAATVFVVTGRNDDEMESLRAAVKLQVAFYASTPAYRPVLELHGWDFGEELTRLSKQGQWLAMANVVPDEVVDEVAVVSPLDELGPALAARYGDRIQRIGLYIPELPGMPPPVTLTDDDWGALIEGASE